MNVSSIRTRKPKLCGSLPSVCFLTPDSAFSKVPNVTSQNVISEALLGALMTHTYKPTHAHSDSLTLSPCGYSDPSHTHNVSDIWRGSVLQQKEDNVQVAHESSHMYWCEARLRNKATVVLLLCTVGFGASSDK